MKLNRNGSCRFIAIFCVSIFLSLGLLAQNPGRSVPKPKEPVVWVRGTVRDDRGKPVPGASVMGARHISGAVGAYEDTLFLSQAADVLPTPTAFISDE